MGVSRASSPRPAATSQAIPWGKARMGARASGPPALPGRKPTPLSPLWEKAMMGASRASRRQQTYPVNAIRGLSERRSSPKYSGDNDAAWACRGVYNESDNIRLGSAWRTFGGSAVFLYARRCGKAARLPNLKARFRANPPMQPPLYEKGLHERAPRPSAVMRTARPRSR